MFCSGQLSMKSCCLTRIAIWLLVSILLAEHSAGQTAGKLPATASDAPLLGLESYGTSDEESVRLLRDFEAACLAGLAGGEDISASLEMMAAVSNRSEIAALNYADIMERILPELHDADLYVENAMQVSRAYLRLDDADRSNEIMEALIAEYPDPATHWGRATRYVQAVGEIDQGRTDLATERLEELWAVSEGYSVSDFKRIGGQLAELYRQSGRWEDALRVGVPALPESIDDSGIAFFAYNNVATAYLELQDYENAALYFQQLGDFLVDLKARNPSHHLLMEPYPRSVERGLRQARIGLDTLGYQREHIKNELESAAIGALLEDIVAESLTSKTVAEAADMEATESVSASVSGEALQELGVDSPHAIASSTTRIMVAVLGMGAALFIGWIFHRRFRALPTRSRV